VIAGRVAVHRSAVLHPDASRVVAHLFVPGQELAAGNETRASGVVQRILDLDDDTVAQTVSELMDRFGGRHRDLVQTFSHHADRIGNRLSAEAELSEDQWLLLGATFTHEYAIEAAAACNPSMVLHPDQSHAPAGGAHLIMSVRGIGEGHRSSIGFRRATIDRSGSVSLAPAAPFPVFGAVHPARFDRVQFHAHLRDAGEDGETAAYVLNGLAETFTAQDLEEQLAVLRTQRDTRRNAAVTVERLRAIAAQSYHVEFPVDVDLSERILWPAMAAESHGMEDARFVRFADSDGTVTYYATYTAYDGAGITQQLLETQDFTAFDVAPIAGRVAANKGLAFFPRRINGRFAALSRHDQETNAVAFSDDRLVWDHATTLQSPRMAWEAIQLGNCGSPIETDDGWLVLTHGVGPMRTYCIGALLLDLDDPTVVIGQLPEPLLSPTTEEQDGYVPNVVYSCGGVLHGDTLVIPYGIADTSIRIATVSWAELRGVLVSSGRAMAQIR
jgi:predicted GH43/DUF377 family glycosyl hydrolase